jgi:sugar/nucleoside kinase (ribokinase family)
MTDGPRPLVALLVGSVTRDLELAAPASPARPGGSVLYAALALARLGVATRVVTRLAAPDADGLLAPLRAAGVAVHALPSVHTTTYANDHRAGVDRHELRATSDPLALSDVPAAWRVADVVHLGPLHHDDLQPDVTSGVRGLRGLDLQGLVRVPAGSDAPRVATALARLLAGVDVLQASEHELPLAAGKAPPAHFRRRHAIGELVLTRGARGATVYTDDAVVEVTAPMVRQPRFPLGAGDVFLGVYLAARAAGAGVADAGEVAARAAAAHVADGSVPPGLLGTWYRPGSR